MKAVNRKWQDLLRGFIPFIKTFPMHYSSYYYCLLSQCVACSSVCAVVAV